MENHKKMLVYPSNIIQHLPIPSFKPFPTQNKELHTSSWLQMLLDHMVLPLACSSPCLLPASLMLANPTRTSS